MELLSIVLVSLLGCCCIGLCSIGCVFLHGGRWANIKNRRANNVNAPVYKEYCACCLPECCIV